MNLKLLLIAGVVAAVLGVGLFGGIRLYEDAAKQDKIESELETQNSVNTLACDAYSPFGYLAFKDEMTRVDYEENYRAVQLLTELGGTPEYVSLLEGIKSGYVTFFDDGGPVELVDALIAIESFCAEYAEQ